MPTHQAQEAPPQLPAHAPLEWAVSLRAQKLEKDEEAAQADLADLQVNA